MKMERTTATAQLVAKAFQDQVFRSIISSSIYNRSLTQTSASGWLGEVQTYSWNSNSADFIFPRPWSKGNFSNKEITEIEELFQSLQTEWLHLLHIHASQWMLELKPEAWLSTGPNPGPSHLLLVCHVSGFHPKPISVMWMRGEQALQGSQQSDILPNADGTWYLHISLDVEATETSGLSCRVKHSSLEGQDIILYLDRPNSTGLIVLAVMVPLVLLLTGLAFWLKKRRTHCEPPPTLLRLE